MKKILVFPVKNEAWILDKTLSCASLWADHIVVAYQESDDGTLEILKRFSKVLIVKNKESVHSSNVRKLLLDAARQFDGNNAIFSFDADEIPTAHILSKEWELHLESLSPRTAIEMQWINLWRSVSKYRNDDSVWSNSWKQFGFIDDRKLEYKTINIVNDHTSRIPSPVMQKNIRFEQPKVLHYQFTDWERMLAKQRLYRVNDFLQKDKSMSELIKINNTYYSTKATGHLKVDDIPADWVQGYLVHGIDLRDVGRSDLSWYDRSILKWFKEKTPEYFSKLDIWDVDWETKRQSELKFSKDIPKNPILDPRSGWVKFYHNHQQKIYETIGIIRKIRKLIS